MPKTQKFKLQYSYPEILQLKKVVDFCLHYECTEDQDTEKYKWAIGAHACECDVEDPSGVLVKELEKVENNFEKSYENQNFTLTR